MIENSNIHILDSGIYYSEIISYIDECIRDTESFIDGSRVLSFSRFVEDEIFQSLIRPWEHDAIVITILKNILPALSVRMSKIFGDYLEDGKWTNVSEKVRSKTVSVPKHNKFSESVFGYVDRMIREKPNISTIAKESIIMFTHNKTLVWLEEQKSKSEIMVEARRNVNKLRTVFKQRQEEINMKRKELLAEKLKAAENAEQNRLKRLGNFTNAILHWGLWQTEEQVNFHLSLYPKKQDKIAGLKAQLNFRQEFLKQKPVGEEYKDVYLVSKSENGKKVACDPDELSVKLKMLIRHSFTIPTRDYSSGVVLVGRNIKLKFETDGQIKWENGFVISKVPGYGTWFNCKFENDRAIYTYELLEDYRKGEVEIIV